MFYRIAWRSQRCPFWQWKSTPLRSLDAASGYLRLYAAYPQNRLRTFRGASRAELDEQLARENKAVARASRPAASPAGPHEGPAGWMSQATTPDGIRTYSCGEAPALAAVAVLAREPHQAEPTAAPGGDVTLESRRVLLEQGEGGDYDEPYTFTLPDSVKQMLVWAGLLAQVRRGELEP